MKNVEDYARSAADARGSMFLSPCPYVPITLQRVHGALCSYRPAPMCLSPCSGCTGLYVPITLPPCSYHPAADTRALCSYHPAPIFLSPCSGCTGLYVPVTLQRMHGARVPYRLPCLWLPCLWLPYRHAAQRVHGVRVPRGVAAPHRGG